MDSIELIRDNLLNSRDIVLSRVEEMQEHCFVPPTVNGGGHTLWVLGHLAFIEAQVIQVFMLGKDNPLAEWETIFDGAEVPSKTSDFPPFEVALAKCREMRGATIAILEGLKEANLDRVSAKGPQGHERLFGIYRRCFQFAADHWYMHRGQLADARRSAGLERMWF